jgi:hypothetical protein
VAFGKDGTADGDFSTVMGGDGSTASGTGATVVGGTGNQALGNNSLAMGTNAVATGAGTFVWNASTPALDTSQDNAVTMAAAGGFYALVTYSAPHGAGNVLLDGPTVATGTVTADGLVDPTYVSMSGQPDVPGAATATTGTFWVTDDLPTLPVFSLNGTTVQLGDPGVGPAPSVGQFNFTAAPGTITSGAGDTWVFGSQSDAAGTDPRMRFFADGTNNSGTLVATTPTGSQVATVSPNQSVLLGINNACADGQAFVAGEDNVDSVGATRTIVGGGRDNQILGAFPDAVIGCGQSNRVSGSGGVVGGGQGNQSGGASVVVAGSSNTSSDHSAVAGGQGNVASQYSGVGGGMSNTAGLGRAGIFGGVGNVASNVGAAVGGGGTNQATGARAVVCGGLNNVSSGNHSAIIGGRDNTADADDAVALGRGAKTQGQANTFVLSGRATGLDASLVTATDTFYSIFPGGYRFWSDAARSVGAQIAAGSSGWSVLCDRTRKENIRTFDNVLERLDGLGIYEYNYIGQDAARVTRGPVAQEWHALFPSGRDARRIGTMDVDAVSLASLRELRSKAGRLRDGLREADSVIADLEAAVAARSQ